MITVPFIIDSAVFYTLKLTVLEPKPVTAKIIAGIVAVIASYILNREWSFQNRGGRERHHEALLFFGFSGVGVLICMAPLYFSSYVLMLRVPEVSLTTENIADFISAYIIGNLLQMAFRFWAFRRWVFPDEFGRAPDKTVESLTAGGAPAHRRGYPSRAGVHGWWRGGGVAGFRAMVVFSASSLAAVRIAWWS